MKMRESRVLRKLRSGEIVSCFKINFCDGQAADLVAGTGFDCLWIDRNMRQVTGMSLMLKTGQQNHMMWM